MGRADVPGRSGAIDRGREFGAKAPMQPAPLDARGSVELPVRESQSAGHSPSVSGYRIRTRSAAMPSSGKKRAFQKKCAAFYGKILTMGRGGRRAEQSACVRA